MTFHSRRAQSLAILKGTGIWRSNYEPPYLRALWRIGFEIPPPHFVPFSQIVTFATAWFSIVWGAIMWVFTWSTQGLTGMSAISISCGAGLFFGFSLALYYAHGRRKYKFPTWESL